MPTILGIVRDDSKRRSPRQSRVQGSGSRPGVSRAAVSPPPPPRPRRSPEGREGTHRHRSGRHSRRPVGSEKPGNFLQHRVALGVPKGIIHLPEVIQIQKGQGKWATIALCPPRFPRKNFKKIAAVIQVGEGVAMACTAMRNSSSSGRKRGLHALHVQNAQKLRSEHDGDS